MTSSERTRGATFSQPIRAITTMLGVCILVGLGVWQMFARLEDIMSANPLLNGVIIFVFGLGVMTCFWQVWILMQSVGWIERYTKGEVDAGDKAAPLLLAPLTTLLRNNGGRRMAISAGSGRSILDSVAQRIDEARDITRYLINLLVFLGLLGTFWGLATTVPAVVETIRNLAPKEGEDALQIFSKLMSGLENQLGGMGTAFSSSLLGLGGSLVLGLLDLFSGHGQNRFYRELEEWLSLKTRIGIADGESGGEGLETGALVQVLDYMAAQMEGMQELHLQSDNGRAAMEARLGELGGALEGLTRQLQGAQEEGRRREEALLRIAEGQERMIALLSREKSADEEIDAENRMRLRSIDLQLLRILEEISAGRQESTADLRADLSGLTAAIRQLSRSPSQSVTYPQGRG